jgi:hypothetical protein
MLRLKILDSFKRKDGDNRGINEGGVEGKSLKN